MLCTPLQKYIENDIKLQEKQLLLGMERMPQGTFVMFYQMMIQFGIACMSEKMTKEYYSNDWVRIFRKYC